MFNKIKIKKRDEGYCVLYKEYKGYFLSKIEIATSLNLEPVQVGSKKNCCNFINNNKTESNFESVVQMDAM